MISIYFYCWWVEDVSFQSPLVGPCLHTHTDYKRASFRSLNPARARTRLEPDICFLCPILAWKPNLPRELRYAQLRSNKKCCGQV